MAGDDYALVVGINSYPGISTLLGAENDARRFHAWVTDPGGGDVPAENARRILSADFPVPANVNAAEPATRAIEDFFDWIDDRSIANNAANLGQKAGSRLWLFFSGHGFSPALDRSGVLTANATSRRVHNIAARMWADRLYDGGWFDDVVLFQDACRTRIREADLNPPFLRPRQPSNRQVRRRYYAFAASNDKVAKEVTLPGGEVGGVFTTTLMEGLAGFARDPATGVLKTTGLTEHLQKNMRNLLAAADLEDDDVAKTPDVLDPDPFQLLPPPPGFAAPSTFPVTVIPSRPGTPGAVLDASLRTVRDVVSTPAAWSFTLPVGFYKAVVTEIGEKLFQVTGSLDASGAPSLEVVDV